MNLVHVFRGVFVIFQLFLNSYRNVQTPAILELLMVRKEINFLAKLYSADVSHVIYPLQFLFNRAIKSYVTGVGFQPSFRLNCWAFSCWLVYIIVISFHYYTSYMLHWHIRSRTFNWDLLSFTWQLFNFSLLAISFPNFFKTETHIEISTHRLSMHRYCIKMATYCCERIDTALRWQLLMSTERIAREC